VLLDPATPAIDVPPAPPEPAVAVPPRPPAAEPTGAGPSVKSAHAATHKKKAVADENATRTIGLPVQSLAGWKSV
jgi:hypothetical protein